MEIPDNQKLTDLERVNVILEYFKQHVKNHYSDEKAPYAELFSDTVRGAKQ